MPHDDLSDLFSQARRASARLDTERAELAFETRMQAIIRGTARLPGPALRFHLWLRATIGLATAVGILAFFFIAGREGMEMEDTLTAWWSGNSAVWDLQLFN